MMHSASSVIAESTNPNDLLPKPRTIEQTGIPSRLLESLLLKHLSQAIDLDVPHLSLSMALPGNLIDILAQKLKAERIHLWGFDSIFDFNLRSYLLLTDQEAEHHTRLPLFQPRQKAFASRLCQQYQYEPTGFR